ncbi:MAG: hypothetical protein JSV01_06375, partial [Desulfobacterales bacterium]
MFIGTFHPGYRLRTIHFPIQILATSPIKIHKCPNLNLLLSLIKWEVSFKNSRLQISKVVAKPFNSGLEKHDQKKEDLLKDCHYGHRVSTPEFGMSCRAKPVGGKEQDVMVNTWSKGTML